MVCYKNSVNSLGEGRGILKIKKPQIIKAGKKNREMLL